MSPFAPWVQQPALPPGAEEKPPVDYATKKYGWPWQKVFWEEPWRGLFETTPEGERGAASLAGWIRDIGIALSAGTAVSTIGGGAALTPLAALLKQIPWLGKQWGTKLASLPLEHSFLGGLGLAGLGQMASPGQAPPTPAEPPGAATVPPTTAPTVGETRAQTDASGKPYIERWDGTNWTRTTPDEDEDEFAWEEPYVITDPKTGQLAWFNPNTGEITPTRPIEPPQARLTPEQEIGQAGLDRQAQIDHLRLQYELEQQAITAQMEQQRQMQEAAAAQQMAQMYAADPYKYWAQMGQGTPGAVARLTGGQVAPGEQMGQVPLSTPSAQWWQNLLPSEQQQISGGLNWLGVDPQDWYSMYQRMIPGLGQRQMEPMWAR